MTLAQIMKLALRQLGEDDSDIAEFDEEFKIYANIGYDIAMNLYYKPKDVLTLPVRDGCAPIDGQNIRRVIAVMDMDDRDIRFEMSMDGSAIMVSEWHKRVRVLCQIRHAPLERMDDEPRLPDEAHAAIADYICYRHLMNGNMAKQQRGQAYYTQFYQTVSRITPQGAGSVTRMKNLYAATDIRRR